MSDQTKVIAGVPSDVPSATRQPGHPAPTVVTSTNLNADHELPKAKPEQPKVIAGVPKDVPSATRQPGHPAPTVVTSGQAKA
jgi:hypothetical protein